MKRHHQYRTCVLYAPQFNAQVPILHTRNRKRLRFLRIQIQILIISHQYSWSKAWANNCTQSRANNQVGFTPLGAFRRIEKSGESILDCCRISQWIFATNYIRTHAARAQLSKHQTRQEKIENNERPDRDFLTAFAAEIGRRKHLQDSTSIRKCSQSNLMPNHFFPVLLSS